MSGIKTEAEKAMEALTETLGAFVAVVKANTAALKIQVAACVSKDEDEDEDEDEEEEEEEEEEDDESWLASLSPARLAVVIQDRKSYAGYMALNAEEAAKAAARAEKAAALGLIQ